MSILVPEELLDFLIAKSEIEDFSSIVVIEYINEKRFLEFKKANTLQFKKLLITQYRKLQAEFKGGTEGQQGDDSQSPSLKVSQNFYDSGPSC